nr:TIGR02588 family protein [Azospirillum rugosum]
MREADAGTTRAASSPPWERLVAALGVVLIVAMIGSMVYFALTHERSVPAITIETEPPRPAGQSHVVRFRAVNGTGTTAAALHIRGELRQGDTVVETSEATLDYLPGDSERFGGLFFRHDPARYELRVFPVGYNEP